MAKIHTHYDNLKVSRHAPQEVIRAAYKALSQKYHPDKNPGDERAARIMAIVNTAYNILSDPVRRKEHDEWIAAEEWEVEWLESSHGEDGRDKPRGDAGWEPRHVDARARARVLRDPRWWGAMLACLGLGAAVVFIAIDAPRMLPSALAFAGKPTAGVSSPAPTGQDAANAGASASASASAAVAEAPAGDAVAEARSDGWARPAGQPESPDAPPDVKALGVTQLVVPARQPDCDTDLQSQIAPNGDPWPPQSGYIDGFPLGNQGEEMQVLVDNSSNPSPVLVKIYDLDRHSNVRYTYVLGRAKFLIDKLAAGKYEVRYQNILLGGARTDCINGKRVLRQAAAPHPDA
ncbi:J domain-containing protein [Massilia sp. 9096]|uniref:J domain-containing protein n=1 Tax=Massilia sp. 9096 TaxID=1500894 RepID=UPI00055DA1DA|nr:J domain-containing protein [Massilia sp. 9096]